MTTITNTMLAYGDFAVESDTITRAGLAYLLQYGWSQSLQDAVAGVAKEVREAAKANDTATGDAQAKAEAKWGRLVDESNIADPGMAKVSSDVAAVVQAVINGVTTARQTKRADAIMAGTVGSSVRGPRLPIIDRMVRDVAEQRIRVKYAKAKANGVNLGPLPTGAALTAIIDRMVAKRGDELRAEAERRMAAVADESDDDDIESMISSAGVK